MVPPEALQFTPEERCGIARTSPQRNDKPTLTLALSDEKQPNTPPPYLEISFISDADSMKNSLKPFCFLGAVPRNPNPAYQGPNYGHAYL